MKKVLATATTVFIAITALAGSVTLGWTVSPTPTVTHTRIYYGVASGNYTNFLAVPMPAATCTVSNLVAGQRYWFTAVATDGIDEAVPSNEVTAKMKPEPAKNLNVLSRDP